MAQGSQPAGDWTFITVTYNSAEALRTYWGTGVPPGVRWIVIDNDSDDGSVSTARDLGADVISLGANLGFGAANNIGLDRATSTFVAFVNPDVTVSADSLPHLAKAIRTTGGLVAPQLIYQDGHLQANGRGFPELPNKVLHRVRPHSARVAHEYLRYCDIGETRHVCWAMGAALCGERTTFDALGGWDPSFFIYYEDKEICLRAWSSGYSVVIVGDARWVHGWARETTRLRWTPWRHEFASMTRFYYRYPELIATWKLNRSRYGMIAKSMREPVPREA